MTPASRVSRIREPTPLHEATFGKKRTVQLEKGHTVDLKVLETKADTIVVPPLVVQ